MTAIPDINTLINIMTGGAGQSQQPWIYIDPRVDSAAAVATVSGRYTSLWQYNKNPGGFGTAPTTVSIPTNTTNGGFFQADPPGGEQSWLVGLCGTSSSIGNFYIYDRLAQNGNLDGTVTSAQTFSMTPTRYTSTASAGNQIFVEIYTQIGASATTVTVSYTNQAGTSGRTTKSTAIGNTGLREAQRIIPLALQDSDLGVSSIQSLTLNATTGTAGAFGVTIGRILGMSAVAVAGAGFVTDFITSLPSMPQVQTGACLTGMWLAGSVTPPNLTITPTIASL